jgi:hypothetical protein
MKPAENDEHYLKGVKRSTMPKPGLFTANEFFAILLILIAVLTVINIFD